MPSVICCCAASNEGHRGWIWRTIHICPLAQVRTTQAADYMTLLVEVRA